MRNKAISSELKVLIFLRFTATNCFQIVCGDLFGVDKYSVCRIIKEVSNVITSKFRDYITFPQDLQKLKDNFYEVGKFPSVIGAIDGTHIRLDYSVSKDIGEKYINRKGWYSLNCQCVCVILTSELWIWCVWHGSVHDARVFENSSLHWRLENKLLNRLLLGDQGYPCRSYLMTSFANPSSTGEKQYNNAHIKTRNLIERTFGIWKRRFPLLRSGVRLKVNRVPNVIASLAILHNIAIDLAKKHFEDDTTDAYDPALYDMQ